METSATQIPRLSHRGFSSQAQERLRKPLRRGRFQSIDAARAGLAQVSVADEQGQARVYYLVDADTHVIEDARFLGFGSLSSHPLTDKFCDTVRGQTLEAVAELDVTVMESELRDSADTPAVPNFPASLAFLDELKTGGLAAKDSLEVPPPPVEVPRYERKREQDWDDNDRAWLPLSLLQKIAKATEATDAALQERLQLSAGSGEITGLHDDFQIHLRLHAQMEDDQFATAARFVEEALRSSLHPAMTVTLADDLQEASS